MARNRPPSLARGNYGAAHTTYTSAVVPAPVFVT